MLKKWGFVDSVRSSCFRITISVSPTLLLPAGNLARIHQPQSLVLCHLWPFLHTYHVVGRGLNKCCVCVRRKARMYILCAMKPFRVRLVCALIIVQTSTSSIFFDCFSKLCKVTKLLKLTSEGSLPKITIRFGFSLYYYSQDIVQTNIVVPSMLVRWNWQEE